MLWTLFGILGVVVLVVLAIIKKNHDNDVERQITRALQRGELKETDVDRVRASNSFPVPSMVNYGLMGLIAVMFSIGMWNQVFFYAEPGYVYHVRTILGQERVVDDVGYNYYLFGSYNAWKKAMSVQAVADAVSDSVEAEKDRGSQLSANLPPERVVFLDQVDARVQATVRFLLPTDRESFLRIAREYRSPENLIRTGLIPAFRETLQANASLMGAEEYYSGGRTEFNTEFEAQMKDGIYLVRRNEIRVADETAEQAATANASLGTNQQQFGDGTKVVFEVEKEYNADGTVRRKPQQFVNYGITVIDARITDVMPNQKFLQRMELKQKAAADRAIAREQRIQEEEQKLLAEARAQREVAERKGAALVEQAQKTTEAETAKQLAITDATRMKEQAEIDRETAAIRLEQARIDAERQRTLADAAAYEKQVILEADNALAQKLEAEVEIQKLWADAFARRSVPQYVFGAGDGSPTGSNDEASTFMQILTMDAAKRLGYDRQAAPQQ